MLSWSARSNKWQWPGGPLMLSVCQWSDKTRLVIFFLLSSLWNAARDQIFCICVLSEFTWLALMRSVKCGEFDLIDWFTEEKKIKSPKETRRSQKPPRVRDEAEFRLLRTRGQKNAQQLVWDETNWSQWTLMFWTGIYFMSSRQTESEIPALWTSLHHKEWDAILNHTEKWHGGSSSVIYCDVS